MIMKTSQATILMNMCMIYNDNGEILVLNRKKEFWPGITFPGGHVEANESFVASTIREVKEETNLDVSNLKLCGINQWVEKSGLRHIVFLFKTKDYSGEIKSSIEGDVFWIKSTDLSNYKLANDFNKIIKVFYNDDISELFYLQDDLDNWIDTLL